MAARSSDMALRAVADFETDRLTARHWGPPGKGPERERLERDLERLLAPAVLSGLPPSLDPHPHGIPAWITARAAEADILLLHLRESDDAVGFLILAPGGGISRTLHLGYVIGRDHWGRGYAGEAVLGLVDALEPLFPIELRAGVAASNRASIRVLEKAGFRPLERVPTDGGACQFALRLPDPGPRL